MIYICQYACRTKIKFVVFCNPVFWYCRREIHESLNNTASVFPRKWKLPHSLLENNSLLIFNFSFIHSIYSFFLNFFYFVAVNSLHPNIKLTEDSGIMFGEKKDRELSRSHDLEKVSSLY